MYAKRTFFTDKVHSYKLKTTGPTSDPIKVTHSSFRLQTRQTLTRMDRLKGTKGLP